MRQLILLFIMWNFTAPALAQDVLFQEASKAYSEGDYEKSALLFEDLIREDSLNVTAMRYSGYSLQGLGRHKEAVWILGKAAQVLHDDIPLRLALARSYEATGRPEKARRAYREAYEIDTTGILGLGRLAQFLFDEKEWGSAKEMLRLHLKKEPANDLLLLRLGVCEWNLGNIQEAAAILQTAHRVDPENAEVVNQLSLLYVQMEMFESALKVLGVGLNFHEREALFHKRTADILFKQRRFSEAISSYTVSIQLGDSSAGTFRSVGASQFFLNNHEDALVSLRKSASIDDTEALTSYYLGLVWQKLGQQDSSIASLEKAISLSRVKFIADALTQMSVSYELKENLVGAVTSLKKAIGLTPENKVLLFYLASLYDRHYADRSAARKYYEEFIRTAPEAEEGILRQAIGRLRALREEEHFRSK